MVQAMTTTDPRQVAAMYYLVDGDGRLWHGNTYIRRDHAEAFARPCKRCFP
jgi:hypothetical protein